jgi:hypothetical protein
MGCCDARVDLTTCGALCYTCIWADRREAPLRCQSQPVSVRISARSCPRGKFAADRETVRWAWLAWYGLPAPLRVAMWLDKVARYTLAGLKPDRLPGCGCWKPLKDVAVVAMATIARLRRPNR